MYSNIGEKPEKYYRYNASAANVANIDRITFALVEIKMDEDCITDNFELIKILIKIIIYIRELLRKIFSFLMI